MMRATNSPTERPGAAKRRSSRLGLAAVLVTAGVLVAACSSGSDPAPSSGAGGQSSPANQSGIAFAACMRANGVPNFPDSAISDSNGRVEMNIPSGIDTNSSQFQSAMQTCRKDLPNGGSSGNGSSSGSSTQAVIKFANCMRSHGVPNFPEPNAQGQELITGSSGINPNSPQFQSAMAACQSLLPAGAVEG
jgi:hypothetical protein